MLFSSLEFVFLFLPVAVGVYFLLPRRAKNIWLLLSGLAFYGFAEPKFLPLMVLTVALDYSFGLLIERQLKKRKSARALLILALALNIGQLAFFKYFAPAEWGLPVGISFYTFQALSYVIDVYRCEVSANKNAVDFGAYVVLFPQLVAGPIVRYSDVERELRERRHSLLGFAEGMRTFCVGLAKKAILANTAGGVWESLAGEQSFVGSALAIFFFAMQIYFDFSGYSDMAIGLGRVFGFSFPQNFNYPYTAKSISEFWRRWHISLSSWFREYVYIPLGGNRRGRVRTYLNLAVTWALTGIWHGATVNFLLWGLYFAILLIIEKAFLEKALKRAPSVLRHAYALFFIGLGWVIFVSDGTVVGFDGLACALRLVGVGVNSFISPYAKYELARALLLAPLLIIGATPLPKRLYLWLKRRFVRLGAIGDVCLPIFALLLSVAYIVSSGYNPFLYFRF